LLATTELSVMDGKCLVLRPGRLQAGSYNDASRPASLATPAFCVFGSAISLAQGMIR